MKKHKRQKAHFRDAVNHPSHYAAGFSNGAEVIDIAENLTFNLGNVVKYCARAGQKLEIGLTLEQKKIQDLLKAQWYLVREITRLTKGNKQK